MFIDSMGFVLWGELIFWTALFLIMGIISLPILWAQFKISKKLDEWEKRKYQEEHIKEWRKRNWERRLQEEEEINQWKNKFWNWYEKNTGDLLHERKGRTTDFSV